MTVAPTPDDQATASVLSLAKWWTGGFAAIGAAVLAGVSIADSGSLKLSLLVPALVLALLAFTTCVWLLFRVRRVFVPLVLWENLSDAEKLVVEALGYSKEEILRWQASSDHRSKAAAARAEVLSRVTRQRTESAFAHLEKPFVVGISFAFICFLGFVVVTGSDDRSPTGTCASNLLSVRRLDDDGGLVLDQIESCSHDPQDAPIYVVPSGSVRPEDFQELVRSVIGPDCSPRDARLSGWLVSPWAPDAIVVTLPSSGCPSVVWQLDDRLVLAVPR